MKNYILFDFDGVIADSFQLAFDVQKQVCPHVTEELYRRRFEGNINNGLSVDDGHTEACQHDMDFHAEYVPRLKTEVHIVSGIEEVIVALKKTYTLVVISSSITSAMEDFLESHDLSTHFAWIMGNDVHQSKVEKMKMVFEKYSTTAENCVFITDTVGDMREASEMNVGTIGVSWGFHEIARLMKEDPFCIVEKSEDIPSAVNNYFQK